MGGPHYLTGLGDVRVEIACKTALALALLEQLELPPAPIDPDSTRYLLVDSQGAYLDGVSQGSPQEGLARNFLEGLTQSVAQSQCQLLLLHAAALISPLGWCYVLPGASGCGKTTLSMGLALSGWRLLSDELVGLSADLQVSGFLRPVHIRNGGLKVLPLTPKQCQAVINTSEGGILPSAMLSGSSAVATVATERTRLIFPGRGEGGRLSSTKLTLGETLLRLMGVNINARNLHEHGFRRLARWVRHCGAGRALAYDHWSSAAEYLRGLES